jgi:coat protein Gp5
MAVANTYSDLLPKLWGQVAVTVRQNSVLPRLVMNLSDSIAGTPGEKVSIPDQVIGVTRAVTADIDAVDPANMTLTKTDLTLDNWREAPFTINDKMAAEIVDGTIPRVVRAYAVALAEYIDSQGMAVYPGVYNTGLSDALVGDMTVPSAFTVDATKNPTGLRAWNEAQVLMNQLGAPKADRRIVLSPFDEGGALINSQFLKADERGDQGGIIDGQIGRKLGQDWWMDQAIPTHTSGTLADTATQTLTCPTAAVGDTAITFVGTITTALTLKVGDIFKFSNHNQTYVNNTLVTSTTNSLAVTSFSPPLKVAVTSANSAAVLNHHKVNLMFHPDAIAFASRPLGGVGSNPNIVQAFDEVSGLNLRVETYRQHKQDYISIDALFGWKLRDAKLIARVASVI